MKGKKLYVGNLPFSTTDQELEDIFKQLGPVASAQVATCRDTGRSKGFGFVEMKSEDEAQNAISQFNGAELGGRSIVVNEFRA
jgi:RNA recognition motif-containing protein